MDSKFRDVHTNSSKIPSKYYIFKYGAFDNYQYIIYKRCKNFKKITIPEKIFKI